MSGRLTDEDLATIREYACARFNYRPRSPIDIAADGQIFIGSDYVGHVRGDGRVVFDRFRPAEPMTIEQIERCL